MTEFVGHCAFPLLLGLFTVAAGGTAGVVVNVAIYRTLPSVEYAAAPGKTAVLLLLHPANWGGVWLLGLPAFLALKHWG